MKQNIARFISNLFNPFLVSFVTIIFIVLAATDSAAAALKWIAVALALSVVPVFLFILYRVRRKKLGSFLPESPEQRKVIYVFASVVAAAGCAVMWWFQAPEQLAVAFSAGLLAVVIFMVINVYWKISLHAAFMTAAATVLTIFYGIKAAWVFLLLPPVGWARLELKLHTPAQVIWGALVAAVIIYGVSRGLGIL